jgi:hypothetical protein
MRCKLSNVVIVLLAVAPAHAERNSSEDPRREIAKGLI